jgi:hypothetical protein
MDFMMFCWRSTTDFGTRGFACKDSKARIGCRLISKGSNCGRLFTEIRKTDHYGNSSHVIDFACIIW